MKKLMFTSIQMLLMAIFGDSYFCVGVNGF